MPPAAVAFDLMDTVVRDPFREAVRAATGMGVEELAAHRDPEAWPAFERGELTEVEYFARWGGVEVDVDAFHRIRRSGYAFVPGMAALLDDLAGKVTRIAATNYPVWVEELMDGLLEGCFEAVVASYRVGARKPNPRFFRRLCDEVGIQPSKVLFVDDRPVNVEGAARAGLDAHLFRGAEQLRATLRDRGVEV